MRGLFIFDIEQGDQNAIFGRKPRPGDGLGWATRLNGPLGRKNCDDFRSLFERLRSHCCPKNLKIVPKFQALWSQLPPKHFNIRKPEAIPFDRFAEFDRDRMIEHWPRVAESVEFAAFPARVDGIRKIVY